MFDGTQEKVCEQIDFIPGFNGICPEDETFQAFQNGFAVGVYDRIHHDIHLIIQESWHRSMSMVQAFFIINNRYLQLRLLQL